MATRATGIAVGTALSDTVTITDVGSAIGDLLSFFIFVGGNQTRTLSAVPSGMTQIATGFVQGSTNGASDSWFAYYAGTTRAGSYTFTVSGGPTSTPIVAMVASSGRITSNPTNFTVTSDTLGHNGGNSPVTVTLSGVTALAGDDLLFVPVMNNTAAWSFTAPSGFVNQQTATANPSNSDKGAMNLQTKDNISSGAAGPTGSITTTATGANSDF